MSIPTNSEILKRFTNELRIAPRDTNPKRKRGFRQRSPRLRFGLVCPVGYPSENRSCSPGLARLTITGRMVITPRIPAEDITPARKFRMLLHINPTRQRGKRTGSLAGASGWYMTFFAAGVIGTRGPGVRYVPSDATLGEN
jgi:hypothetical protein